MAHKLLVLISILFLASCLKDPKPVLDDEVPTCILDEIESFKNLAGPCELEGPSVKEYKFQGELVYVFDDGQCISDGASKVLSADCTELCVLGTILGITDCRGESFANAEEIRTIWEN